MWESEKCARTSTKQEAIKNWIWYICVWIFVCVWVAMDSLSTLFTFWMSEQQQDRERKKNNNHSFGRWNWMVTPECAHSVFSTFLNCIGFVLFPRRNIREWFSYWMCEQCRCIGLVDRLNSIHFIFAVYGFDTNGAYHSVIYISNVRRRRTIVTIFLHFFLFSRSECF